MCIAGDLPLANFLCPGIIQCGNESFTNKMAAVWGCSQQVDINEHLKLTQSDSSLYSSSNINHQRMIVQAPDCDIYPPCFTPDGCKNLYMF